MARYNKIYRGPSIYPQPQVRELPAAADILPGTLVRPNADASAFEVATTGTGTRLYVTQDNYLAQKGTDTAVPEGDVLIGLELMDDRIYAARLAAGEAVTVGDPLTVGADGALVAAAAGALVVAHANETYTNDTGSSELIDIRFGQTYVATA